jgi:hypothetical protein
MAELVYLCPFCGNPVDPMSKRTWHRVVGWERRAGTRPSGKQGGSDITLREAREEFAHPACIALAKDGLLGQEALL